MESDLASDMMAQVQYITIDAASVTKDTLRTRLARYTKQQPDLPPGTSVAVQNQTGRHPTKWDKTGVILENKPHSQVLIRIDGSRKATLRNRKFVRQILPATTAASALAVQTLDRHARSPPLTPLAKAIPLRVPVRGKSEDGLGPSTTATAAVTFEHQPHDFANDADKSLDHQVTEFQGPKVTESPSRQGANRDKPETVPDNIHRETSLPLDETQMTQTTSGSRPRRVTKPSTKYSPELYDPKQ